MSDLIRRENIYDAFDCHNGCVGCRHNHGKWNCRDVELCLEDICDIIDKLQAVDAVEVVHAHWIPHQDDWGADRYECSHCHSEWVFLEGGPEDNDAFYCNHCGAKMDEERKDGAE